LVTIMAVSSASGAQSASSGLWAQIQLQQARQNADQAEQQAAALQSKAQAAQRVADRAQEDARSLQVASRQAQGDASQARLDLAKQDSVGKIQGQLSDLKSQITQVLKSDLLNAPAAVVAAPVVNTSGQQTGTLVNVTA
jgi:chromosome segregation ATPase